MTVTFRYCAQCPRRFGMTRREFNAALSQRVYEHRPQPGLWPEARADFAVFAEYLATDALCFYCVEAGAEDAA